MPIGEYFKGGGEKVMAGMKKKYGKRAKEVFYATANARGMKPKSHMVHGASMSPHGDIGMMRQQEAIKLGTFKGVRAHPCEM
mgnify:CR=1 FL=1